MGTPYFGFGGVGGLGGAGGGIFGDREGWLCSRYSRCRGGGLGLPITFPQWLGESIGNDFLIILESKLHLV